jgi:hypothetical protein
MCAFPCAPTACFAVAGAGIGLEGAPVRRGAPGEPAGLAAGTGSGFGSAFGGGGPPSSRFANAATACASCEKRHASLWCRSRHMVRVHGWSVMVSGRGKNVLERRVEKKASNVDRQKAFVALFEIRRPSRRVETLRCVREIPPEISPGSAGAA